MAGATMVFDRARDRVVVHGNDAGAGLPDIWAYAFGSGTWEELCAGGTCGAAPTAVGGAYGIWDPVESALLRFGGTSDGGSTFLDSLWRVWLK